MTAQEFSNTFDTILNSYNSQAAFGDSTSRVNITLDEYEKSVFLTKAQEEIVTNYYSGKNVFGEGFEKTEEIRRYLDKLVKSAEITPAPPTNTDFVLISGDKLAELPNDLWFITYETVKLNNNKLIDVIPVTQDTFNIIKENPFKRSSPRRVLRLDFGSSKVELVCGEYSNNVSTYLIRYISKPSPIILTNLTGSGLTINGQTNEATCTLHEGLHKLILDRAVQLAIASKSTSK